MEIDPAVAAIAGALSTVAGLLYRQLLLRAERAEKGERFWQEKALTYMAYAKIATTEAENQRSST